MNILFFGDIVGRVGRTGVRKVLPQLKAAYKPDIIIANAENIAHGSGVTPKTIKEMTDIGIHFFTSGNHVWDKPIGEEVLQANDPVVIRPANVSGKTGIGHKELEVGGKKLLVINLMGQVWMGNNIQNPFHYLDLFLQERKDMEYDAIFVDFHAEATSEKVAFGWHADRLGVSAVVSTHTHIPTADARVLPNGTAYISDVGMCGPRNSVIGVEIDPIINRFLEKEERGFSYPETGTCDVNAVFITIGENKKATSIELVQRSVET